jgi:UDP-N-acetylenolpyruvoylglucosamine reductase
MKILQNENLAKYTTINIGGVAKFFYIPETKDELIQTLSSLINSTYYLLGAGSNLLINDTKVFMHVISLSRFNMEIIPPPPPPYKRLMVNSILGHRYG